MIQKEELKEEPQLKNEEPKINVESKEIIPPYHKKYIFVDKKFIFFIAYIPILIYLLSKINYKTGILIEGILSKIISIIYSIPKQIMDLNIFKKGGLILLISSPILTNLLISKLYALLDLEEKFFDNNEDSLNIPLHNFITKKMEKGKIEKNNNSQILEKKIEILHDSELQRKENYSKMSLDNLKKEYDNYNFVLQDDLLNYEFDLNNEFDKILFKILMQIKEQYIKYPKNNHINTFLENLNKNKLLLKTYSENFNNILQNNKEKQVPSNIKVIEEILNTEYKIDIINILFNKINDKNIKNINCNNYKDLTKILENSNKSLEKLKQAYSYDNYNIEL